MNFNYYLPVNLIFGRGKISMLGEEVRRLGGRALIVTGQGSAKKTGLLDRVVSMLGVAGVSSVIFDRIDPNPLTDTVYTGSRLANEQGCDVVVGVGGGSVMDAAKAIAFCMKNEGDVSDYIFGLKTGDTAAPVALVPTTCGTGSEGNCFAVLTNPQTKDKKSLRTSVITPKVSIIDPELMMTMPKQVFASVAFDALCHNLEAYISGIAQPLTDMYSAYALRLLGDNLLKAYNTWDADAFECVTLASTLGGMAINTAGACAAHGMEHPVSGLYNVVHGRGLAALTPTIIEMSEAAAPKRFAEIAGMLGGRDCASAVRELLAATGMTVTLSELGVKEGDIPWLAKNCIKVSLPSMKNNPRVFSQGEIEEIYYKCM